MVVVMVALMVAQRAKKDAVTFSKKVMSRKGKTKVVTGSP